MGMAAKRIGEAAARPAKMGDKMEFLKRKIAPLKKRRMPLEKLPKAPLKGMPLKNVPKKLPTKGEKPGFMKPKYVPGDAKRGYTKYA